MPGCPSWSAFSCEQFWCLWLLDFVSSGLTIQAWGDIRCSLLHLKFGLLEYGEHCCRFLTLRRPTFSGCDPFSRFSGQVHLPAQVSSPLIVSHTLPQNVSFPVQARWRPVPSPFFPIVRKPSSSTSPKMIWHATLVEFGAPLWLESKTQHLSGSSELSSNSRVSYLYSCPAKPESRYVVAFPLPTGQIRNFVCLVLAFISTEDLRSRHLCLGLSGLSGDLVGNKRISGAFKI